MAKALVEKHAKAIELRKMGWSYSAIRAELDIAKSTASAWLNEYPLSHKQLDKLQFHSEVRIEHFRETFRKKRDERNRRVYEEEKKMLSSLTTKEIYIAGLMLYWGEGQKASNSRVSFSNTNPDMIRFAVRWFTGSCSISRDKLKVRLHLYSDMDIEVEHEYWSGMLNIPQSQFRTPYIKQSLRSSINEKGTFGHGTCDLFVEDAILKTKIMMGIKVVADYFSGDSDKMEIK
jgi:hypothetical protein